jgi:hypothetical protein
MNIKNIFKYWNNFFQMKKKINNNIYMIKYNNYLTTLV